MSFFSFTKADRILKHSEFLRLSRSGKKLYDKRFIAIFDTGRFERTRLGLTVSRKVGNAVTRNRIKRFSHEYFRLNKHNIKGCWDINIIARKEAANLTSNQVFLSLQNIFGRISGVN